MSKATTFLEGYQLPKIGSFLILSELDPENKRLFLIISVFLGYFIHPFPEIWNDLCIYFPGLGLNSGYEKKWNVRWKLNFWMRNLSLFFGTVRVAAVKFKRHPNICLTDEIQSSLVMAWLITSFGFTSISTYE